jgi:hypothetical protein
MQRGSGAVRTPEAHWAYPGSSRAPQPSGSLPGPAGCAGYGGESGTRTHARAQPAYRLSRAAPCPAWVSLRDGRPGRGGGGRESRTPRPACAGRPLSRRVGSPHARALHDRHSCTAGCGPDQVRTGALRLDGATGTPLPYGAVRPPPHWWGSDSGAARAAAPYASRGSNPDDQVKSLARWPLRERRSVGATGLAPVCHSEAALQAAAFAARPHPHDGSGRGGPLPRFLASLHRWLVSSG